MNNTKIIALKPIVGNEPTHLNKTQDFFQPHVDQIIIFWWIVFWLVTATLIWKLFNIWKKQYKK